MHQIHRHALHIISDQQLPAGGGLIHQHGSRVHHAAVNQKGADKAEQGQRKPISAQQTLAEQHTGQQADDAHGKHLIRRPGALLEVHIGQQHGQGTHQKARLAAQCHSRNDDQRRHRLEVGQHHEGHSACHAHSA